jgi:hypothetical protein
VRHGHGVGLEQYLAVDPEGPDGGLAFGPDEPVDERLAQFRALPNVVCAQSMTF